MIYFIQENGNGNIKVGMADKPEERLATLQLANPNSLKLLYQEEGTRDRELELHEQFKEERTRGEWFKPDKILEYIQDEREKFNRSLSFLPEKFKEGEILCPKCSFEYNHFISIIVIQKNEIVTINSKGTKLSLLEENCHRGSEIIITYICESGHKWYRSQRFHKGIIIYNDWLEEINIDPASEDYPETLWRD